MSSADGRTADAHGHSIDPATTTRPRFAGLVVTAVEGSRLHRMDDGEAARFRRVRRILRLGELVRVEQLHEMCRVLGLLDLLCGQSVLRAPVGVRPELFAAVGPVVVPRAAQADGVVATTHLAGLAAV